MCMMTQPQLCGSSFVILFMRSVHSRGARPVTLTSTGRRMFMSLFFSSRRRHTRFDCDWSSDVCSSDLAREKVEAGFKPRIEKTTQTKAQSSGGSGARFRRRVQTQVALDHFGQSAEAFFREIGRASCRERV